MVKPIPIVHHPDYVAPLPVASRFPMDKFAAVAEALRAADVPLAWYEPVPTPVDALKAVHDPDYVDAVLALALPADAERRIGFPVTERVVRRSLLATGGTWLTAKLALEQGAACNTAGGSHHAHAGFGAGYCVFNDVAIAATRLLKDGDAVRILVIDLDVHQGDGTAAIFAADPRVFTFSLHCEANFPARKAVSDLDIGLAVGTSDAAYLESVAAHVPQLIAQHQPTLIFYIAGVDPHVDDTLGRLSLSDAGLVARDRLVGTAAHTANIPLAVVMGGGYSADMATLGARHARSLIASVMPCYA
jgi:acetoin utilization deacetylase AcuC-like enzyme